MDLSSVCRTCLCEDSLNPIFLDDNYYSQSTALYITAGVKIEHNDGLPQQMCTKCIIFINTSLKYRKTCKEVEKKLLEIQNNQIQPKIEKHIKLEQKFLVSNTAIEQFKETLIKLETENEMTDLKVLEDDDDKPLKYLLKMETNDANENDETIFLDVENSADSGAVNNFEVENDKVIIEPTFNAEANTKLNRVTCKLCQKTLALRSLDSHMARRHPGSGHRKIKCDLCNNYILKEKMERHMNFVHGSGDNLKCGNCKNEFESKQDLIEHLTNCARRRKASKSDRELRECDICHKTMQKASIRMHKAVKHAGLRPVCEHCGNTFGNKFRLAEHCRAKHDYDKFKCTYCEFQSASTMAMRNHERRHRGEKPFVCETCGAKFHAAYLLTQHKHSHRTQRAVKCDLCPASFKATNSLHLHKANCHSKRLYQCMMCSRCYSCRHYAVKHLRLVHRYEGLVPPLTVLDADSKQYKVNETSTNKQIKT